MMHDSAILSELRKLLAALYPTEADQRRLASEAEPLGAGRKI
jgi:hypothetical protein